MMKARKAGAVVLALVMAVILVMAAGCSGGGGAPIGMSAEPADLFTFEYDMDNKGIRLTGYSGTKLRLKVPDEIEGEPVVGISGSCFPVGSVLEVFTPDTLVYWEFGGTMTDAAKTAAEIVIPEAVTALGNGAFEGCENLTSITIPDGVTALGPKAFFGCSSLTDVTIPHRITKILGDTFAYCHALTTVILPEGVETIGSWAFADCSSLMTVIIPNSVTRIYYDAFVYCGDLDNKTKQKILSINPDAIFEY